MKAEPGSPAVLIGNLYARWQQRHAASIESLPESGSSRKYFRLKADDGKSVIGVFNEDVRENKAFVYLGRHLLKAGIRVPEIYETDLDKGIYLEEDLGDTTLLDRMAEIASKEDQSNSLSDLYRNVIDAMPDIQVKAFNGLDFSKCYPRREFDAQSIMWDLNYFKYNLLKPLRIKFYEQDLEEDFAAISAYLCETPRESFMFRDFQSRNIMLRGSVAYFIDFQGGRKGPLQYDLASLLFEAKAGLGEELRQSLLEHYLSIFSRKFSWFRHDQFLKYYYGFVYLRLMQAMGAYGFRGLIEHKPLFLQSLPLAANLIGWLSDNHPFPVRLHILPDIFQQLFRNHGLAIQEQKPDGLTITVKSFAYKNGIPVDFSGHGGGFVFDCRALHNPGRIESLQEFTGLDTPVIKFLSASEDANDFLSHACHMTALAVETYAKRGFRNLSVSFGCTGGRHRSVYMAERLCSFLKNKYQVNVVIHHTELESSAARNEDLQDKNKA